MIKIVESRNDDYLALQELFLQSRRKTFLWTDTSRYKLSDFDESTKNEYILVAFVDEILVGFVSVWLIDNFIHHLYVDEQYHNQSIGSELLNKVIEKVGYPIRLKCDEKNTKALRFYKQKGFIEKEKKAFENGFYLLLELGV